MITLLLRTKAPSRVDTTVTELQVSADGVSLARGYKNDVYRWGS